MEKATSRVLRRSADIKADGAVIAKATHVKKYDPLVRDGTKVKQCAGFTEHQLAYPCLDHNSTGDRCTKH